ncbi:MAG: penicillin-binding protein activator LpoB [Acidiferrobacter sp.]
MNALGRISLISLFSLLSACATTAIHSSRRPPYAPGAHWAIAPFANYTTTPGAGERAASITASLLLAHGLTNAVAMTAHTQSGLPLESPPSTKILLTKARALGARYVVLGAVQEWRYTIGLDGQPAIAVTINVASARTGHIIWSATASRSGTPRESVGVLAEDTLNAMVNRLLP